MTFKRYVRNVYPIAGIRWAEPDEVSSTDGLLFNIRRIDNDNNRRAILDEQYLIQWQSLVKRINDDLGTPVAEAVNVGTGVPVFKQKEDNVLEFKTLAAGSDITLTDTGNEIVINFTSGISGINQVNALFSVQRPDNPPAGTVFYNKDTGAIEVWNGTEWKILSFE